MRLEESFSIKISSAAIAYLLAVTSAALTFTALIAGSAVLGGFESATENSFFTKLAHLSFMATIFFVVGWLFAFFTAFIPFTVGITIANQLKQTHWLYFVAGGAITAAALCPLYIFIPNLGINVQEPEPSFLQQYLSALPFFVTCGSIAGAVCWRHLRSNFANSLVEQR